MFTHIVSQHTDIVITAKETIEDNYNAQTVRLRGLRDAAVDWWNEAARTARTVSTTLTQKAEGDLGIEISRIATDYANPFEPDKRTTERHRIIVSIIDEIFRRKTSDSASSIFAQVSRSVAVRL